MFATMRRKRRSTRMKNELGQSVDHFKRAASLAAQETSATVGPKINAARDRVQPAAVKAKDAASSSWDSALATLTPLVAAATDNVRQTRARRRSRPTRRTAKKNAKKLEKRANKALGRKQSSGRTGKLVGLRAGSAPPSASAPRTWCVAARPRSGTSTTRAPRSSRPGRSPGPTTPRSSPGLDEPQAGYSATDHGPDVDQPPGGIRDRPATGGRRTAATRPSLCPLTGRSVAGCRARSASSDGPCGSSATSWAGTWRGVTSP